MLDDPDRKPEIGNLEIVTRNVKRWRGAKMALRWAVPGLIVAGPVRK